jgi:hypothetical protein
VLKQDMLHTYFEKLNFHLKAYQDWEGLYLHLNKKEKDIETDLLPQSKKCLALSFFHMRLKKEKKIM